MGAGREVVNAGDRPDQTELDIIARRLSATHPEVERFANQAMAEIGRARKQLAFLEHLNERLEAAAVTVAAQAARQSELLIEQAEQLASAQAHLREVTSLCDLADWSVRTTRAGQPPSVRVDDLRRSLPSRRTMTDSSRPGL
jgi:hypothetical protein